ncbi:protein FAM161B [Nematostella vectensis]|uniref:protein FAM161B n=1 Tax=Nematostella vectensis TaxID=45351 RepID=UPI00207739BF|nr:protein FAM161B [Nematostella vectensis]
MATTHGITAVKNLCYTAPRKPKSKIPATENERIHRTLDLDVSEGDGNASSGRKIRSSNSGGSKIQTPKSIRDSLKQLQTADQADFYKHLVALKKEQKRTLKTVEKMYYSELEKQRSGFDLDENTRISLDYEPQLDIPHHESFDPFEKGYKDEYIEGTQQPRSPVRDFLRDMSSREPTYNREIDDIGQQAEDKENLRRSYGDMSDNDSWHGDEVEDVPRKRTLSSEGRVLYKEMFPRRSAALDVVEDMWKDFSVYDYPRDREDSPQKPTQEKDTWSPCITIPNPFSMTIREAKKTAKQKTRSQRILEEELRAKKAQEEAEIRKKFRAQPVPATTFLPLHDELMRQEELRRHEVREMSKAILKSTEKPFSFMKREEEKKRMWRSKSLSSLNDLTPKKEKKTFRANPFPAKLFDLTLKDKLAEQEEYRTIKNRMRSEEMLASSRLPMNMESRGRHYNIGKLRSKQQKEKEKKAFMTKEHTFRPNINPDVPDFDELQRQFEKEMRRKKREKEPTVVEPFQLRTAHLSAARLSKSTQSLDRGLRGSRSQSRERPSSARARDRPRERSRDSCSSARSSSRERPLSAMLSSSWDTLPFGTTEATRMREGRIRESLKERRAREQAELKEELQRQKKLKSMRPHVARKVMANDSSWQLKKTSDVKIKSFREADRARREEYEQELRDMQSRVSQRPLLFERQSQLNAKRTAERKYEDILRNAGVSDELVRSLVTKDGDIVDAESEDDERDDDYDVTNTWSRRSSAQDTQSKVTSNHETSYNEDESDVEEDLEDS